MFNKQLHRNSLQDLMMDCRRMMKVHFIKKDGTPRIVVGVVEPHSKHTGINNAAHIGKYVTITENHCSDKPTFKNVNLNTVSKVKIGFTTYNIYGEMTNVYL